HRIRQNLPHEAAMKRRQIRRFLGKRLTERLTHGAGNGLPDRPVADMFGVVQHIVEHAMCLSAKAWPIRWVKRISIRRWRCLLLENGAEAGCALDVRRFRWRGHGRRHFYRRNGWKTSVARETG